MAQPDWIQEGLVRVGLVCCICWSGEEARGCGGAMDSQRAVCIAASSQLHKTDNDLTGIKYVVEAVGITVHLIWLHLTSFASSSHLPFPSFSIYPPRAGWLAPALHWEARQRHTLDSDRHTSQSINQYISSTFHPISHTSSSNSTMADK